MSDLIAKTTIEDCYCGYGREDFVLALDDIVALMNGRALSGDVACGEYGITISLSDCAQDVLKSLFNPTRPKGRWIEYEMIYECSNCQIIRAKGMTGKYNFCPNCGADMRGEYVESVKDLLNQSLEDAIDCS